MQLKGVSTNLEFLRVITASGEPPGGGARAHVACLRYKRPFPLAYLSHAALSPTSLHRSLVRCAEAYAAGDTTTKFVENIDYAPHAGACAAWLGGSAAAPRVLRVWPAREHPFVLKQALPMCPNSWLALCAVEVVDAGLQTTVQDYPGRVALWSVGVPPSGAVFRPTAML